MPNRPRLEIVNVRYIDDMHHCGKCCVGYQHCDCELERVPLYAEYSRNDRSYAKSYAYECITCGSLNKV